MPELEGNRMYQPTDVADMPKSNIQSGWERLHAAYRTATLPVDAGSEPPKAPPEVAEWAQNTMIGVFFGVIFAGGRQWIKDRAIAIPPQPEGLPTKLHAAKWRADIQTQRLLNQTRAAVRGGAIVGGLAGVFYAAQLMHSIFKGERTYRDTMVGGMATGVAFGAFMPGPAALRAKSTVLGLGLGGAAGLPIGLLEEYLVQKMPDDPRYPTRMASMRASSFVTEGSQPAAVPKVRHSDFDSTAALVQQMEASLDRSRAEGLPRE